MEALLELFRFLVPYFASTSDADVEQALTLAEAQRPACLTAGKQDEAQIWYAAALLYARQLQTSALAAPLVPVGIKSEKEGDLARTFGMVEGVDDMFGFWKSYRDLAALCGGFGAITVGHRYVPCCC